ncbi:MAG: class I SAM-dependent methyltransferase [Microlunatus sp.]|nr:class I SAM-dependent methyltransferase [Microlunatus sp.]
MPTSSHPSRRHQHGDHRHGVISGWIVRPYDLFVGLVLRGTYRRIAESLTAGIAPGGRVLDIGTGPGHLVEAIARRRPELTVTGVDPSADMLRQADRRLTGLPNAHTLQAAAEDLPSASDSIDVVVSTLSSHHWADPAAALAEQSRVLTPGGRLWLFDLTSHLAADIADQIEAAGLVRSDEDAGLSGFVARRLRLLAAQKPLSAA